MASRFGFTGGRWLLGAAFGLLAPLAMNASSLAQCEFETCGTGGDCFEVNAEPGCSDAACCCTVCEFNPFCCDVEWDAGCVDDANALCGGGGGGGCGDPNSGDCCIANGTPGCDDLSCCTVVCAADAFCCDVNWDALCADAAVASCAVCALPPCPAGDCTGDEDYNEDEPCGSDLNGGCNTEPPAPPAYSELGTIAVGESLTICGNTWAAGGTRDTDWYRFTITENAQVTWEVNGGGVEKGAPGAPTIALIINGSCPAFVIEVGAGSCPTTVASACLLPGEYVVFAGLSVFEGFDCPGVPYTGTLTVAPAIESECPNPPENNTCDTAIEVNEGETFFDNIDATTNGPALSAACESFSSNQIFNDVWFRYTATCDATMTVSTCDTVDFDSRIAIYAENCPELEGEEIACNDDGPGCTGFTSRVTFDAFEGITYIIRIGTFSAADFGSGSFLLCGCDVECPVAPACGNPDAGNCCVDNGTPFCDDSECCDAVCAIDAFCCTTSWDQICADQALALCESCGGGGPGPENDFCSDAIEIELGDTPFSTVGATSSGAASTCPGGNINQDIWFFWVATGDGNLVVSTCDTTAFDTALGAYAACDGEQLACNDDACGLQSQIQFLVTEGETYFLRVGGFGTAFGSGTLTLILTEPPPPPGEPAIWEGSTSEGGGFLRPTSFGATTPTERLYESTAFHVSEDGQYVFEIDTAAPSGSEWDCFALIYQFEFDPGNSLADLIAGDDDYFGDFSVLPGSSASGLRASRIALGEGTNFGGAGTGLFLQAGVQYFAVVTGFGETSFGTYTAGIGGGPGDVTLGLIDSSCPADLDNSGVVDGADLSILLAAWGPCPTSGGCPSDFDDSGVVDGADLSVLLAAWGPCP